MEGLQVSGNSFEVGQNIEKVERGSLMQRFVMPHCPATWTQGHPKVAPEEWCCAIRYDVGLL